jgi:hypothetical protein
MSSLWVIDAKHNVAVHTRDQNSMILMNFGAKTSTASYIIPRPQCALKSKPLWLLLCLSYIVVSCSQTGCFRMRMTVDPSDIEELSYRRTTMAESTEKVVTRECHKAIRNRQTNKYSRVTVDSEYHLDPNHLLPQHIYNSPPSGIVWAGIRPREDFVWSVREACHIASVHGNGCMNIT